MLTRWLRGRPYRPVNPYWLLSLTLFMLVWYVLWYFILQPGSHEEPYGMAIVILMAVFQLLDRLAHESKWPIWLGVPLQVLSLGWTIFAIFYLLFWSHVLYPRG